ncbi:MFS transporter [Runella sp.]|jgi:MFS family permease|uniref:MFS transporter n=1 Tax=Runella sp. TaxID=1960881 RepID=UPI003016DDC0
MHQPSVKRLLSVPVLVAALGYFVDIYDLLLFGIVRIPSLRDLNLSDAQVSSVGASILNWQMTGLLFGGILWGMLGDKKGRLSVLFGSILTYSLANISCGLVEEVGTYKLLRFIAGVGLAGELGAGITLVSEILPKQLRALGTSLVAGIGLLGAVVAYFTAEYVTWRTAYFVGGGLGVSLLVMRVGVFESNTFQQLQQQKHVKRGSFISLFTNMDRLGRYLACIGIGFPTWFVIGILTTFSNEFGQAKGIVGEIQPGLAIMWCYVGLALGDFASGLISHQLRSRRKAVLLLMLVALVRCILFLFIPVQYARSFYGLCLMMGVGIGYWALFVTIAAEQFGTNLRATVTTTVPNMVRGSVVGMTALYGALKLPYGILQAGAWVGLLCFIVGFTSILVISESHNRELDFLEK